MAYETYPKSSKNPSGSIGNQKTSMPTGGGTSYPGKGAAGSRLDTERSKTLVCNGGSGTPNKSDYPGDWRVKFPSEKYEGQR